MSKLYGIGASIVIIGALFKIQHWPLATIMLSVGLITESLIFFISAFEPLHEEIDWSLVYPELAGFPEEETPITMAVVCAIAAEESIAEEIATPFIKLYYPEPFIASPSFVHEEL